MFENIFSRGPMMDYLRQASGGPSNGAWKPPTQQASGVDPDTAREQARARGELANNGTPGGLGNAGQSTVHNGPEGSWVEVASESGDANNGVMSGLHDIGDGRQSKIGYRNGHPYIISQDGVPTGQQGTTGAPSGPRGLSDLSREGQDALRRTQLDAKMVMADPNVQEAQERFAAQIAPSGRTERDLVGHWEDPAWAKAERQRTADQERRAAEGAAANALAMRTTVPLGTHERDRVQQDPTEWWRNRGNY